MKSSTPWQNGWIEEWTTIVVGNSQAQYCQRLQRTIAFIDVKKFSKCLTWRVCCCGIIVLKFSGSSKGVSAAGRVIVRSKFMVVAILFLWPERKTDGGKGVCTLGYAKYFCPAMHFETDTIRGGNAFAYPKWVLKTELGTQKFCLQKWPKSGLRRSLINSYVERYTSYLV